jgi:hypothetical protein
MHLLGPFKTGSTSSANWAALQRDPATTTPNSGWSFINRTQLTPHQQTSTEEGQGGGPAGYQPQNASCQTFEAIKYNTLMRWCPWAEQQHHPTNKTVTDNHLASRTCLRNLNLKMEAGVVAMQKKNAPLALTIEHQNTAPLVSYVHVGLIALQTYGELGGQS